MLYEVITATLAPGNIKNCLLSLIDQHIYIILLIIAACSDAGIDRDEFTKDCFFPDDFGIAVYIGGNGDNRGEGGRITSYNVCYTKLLRQGKRTSGSEDGLGRHPVRRPFH